MHVNNEVPDIWSAGGHFSVVFKSHSLPEHVTNTLSKRESDQKEQQERSEMLGHGLAVSVL